MVVLTNGCSFSRGPGSWPYALQAMYNFDLINLAQAGSGNDYIFESTISELSTRKYDLVIIMWSAPNRKDYRTETNFDSPYTSKYQSAKNDWPEKIIHPINDQDYVEKDWVFGCGHLNGDKAVKDLFAPYYRHVGYHQMVDSFLIKVISLQSILKQRKIDYIFSFYDNYIDELQALSPTLSNWVDWDNCCISDNIDTIMHRNNWFDTDGSHPGINTHTAWAQELKKHIEKKCIDMQK